MSYSYLLGRVRDLELKTSVIDLTGATEDYELVQGQTAKIDISAASTPLNIAVEDGVYEIDIVFDQTTFASDQELLLQANNTTYTNEFTVIRLVGGTDISTDEVDVGSGTVDYHRLDIPGKHHQVNSRLIISGMISTMITRSFGTVGGTVRINNHSSAWPGSIAHTSLGTLVIGEAATGVCYVKRIA